MPRGNPKNLRPPWKPGESGNPSGRPTGLIKKEEIQSLMGKFWKHTREELHAIVTNPRSSMGEVMVASVMAKAAKDGDYARIAFLLDRMIGRPTEVIEQHNHSHDDKLAGVPQDKLLALLKETA